ncbi:hypothetical protein K2173_001526 [Erythroxylum novogranatense]|uniref:SAP30-binding protein n=1 Tax=Erythroxylum novogranatense TaxID=1862640 RepID=A0AAV8T3S6_9ROSI|nr:hypothetical protein K2173_001526 [Erythroxylum novogranatense]
MASSRKKQSEGIALLSMYGDDDDEEMEDLEEEEEEQPQQQQYQQEQLLEKEEAGDPQDHGVPLEDENGCMLENDRDKGTVQGLTPNTRATPSPYGQLKSSLPDEVNSIESEAVEIEGTIEVPVENVDPLDKFLPPPPKEKCPDDLQKRIDKFLALKKVGRSFNAEVRNRKDYRNPDFLLHAVRYQNIDQTGSCFSKDVFDPHGYDKSDYYDEIEADMRRDRERKEQELKRSPKVEFVSGGSQPGAVVPPPKFTVPTSVPSGSMASQAAVDAAGRDGRQNKKSKWDKVVVSVYGLCISSLSTLILVLLCCQFDCIWSQVDVDVRNPMQTSGQDLTSVAAHAALLSAANVGAGYSAFVQQKRREAEEKRASERKLEKRS